jgi:hypothetical protein
MVWATVGGLFTSMKTSDRDLIPARFQNAERSSTSPDSKAGHFGSLNYAFDNGLTGGLAGITTKKTRWQSKSSIRPTRSALGTVTPMTTT